MTAKPGIAQPLLVKPFLDRYSGYSYALMRIIVGLLLAAHGAQKLLGWFPKEGKPAGPLNAMMMTAGTIELVGGLLIAIGFLTVIAAFLASGLMAVAYFMMHAPRGFWPILNGGELAVLYCFVFLYIFFRGSGPLSVDRLFNRTPEPADRIAGPVRNGPAF